MPSNATQPTPNNALVSPEGKLILRLIQHSTDASLSNEVRYVIALELRQYVHDLMAVVEVEAEMNA